MADDETPASWSPSRYELCDELMKKLASGSCIAWQTRSCAMSKASLSFGSHSASKSATPLAHGRPSAAAAKSACPARAESASSPPPRPSPPLPRGCRAPWWWWWCGIPIPSPPRLLPLRMSAANDTRRSRGRSARLTLTWWARWWRRQKAPKAASERPPCRSALVVSSRPSSSIRRATPCCTHRTSRTNVSQSTPRSCGGGASGERWCSSVGRCMSRVARRSPIICSARASPAASSVPVPSAASARCTSDR